MLFAILVVFIFCVGPFQVTKLFEFFRDDTLESVSYFSIWVIIFIFKKKKIANIDLVTSSFLIYISSVFYHSNLPYYI